MTTKNNSHHSVVFLGKNYDGYRVVRQTLQPLEVRVIWSTEANAAHLLVETGNIDMVICDARTLSAAERQLLDHMAQSPAGPAGFALTLPTVSSNPDDLETNMYAYKRLLRAVRSRLCKPDSTGNQRSGTSPGEAP